MSDKYYAIIGQGFAAAVNFATLRLTSFGQALLAGKRVVFIGGEEPWQSFIPHEMGQPASLLSMPGFFKQAKGINNLQSNEFAEIIKTQYDTFSQHCQVERVSSLVKKGGIRRHRGGSVFEIALESGETISASNIDICIGPGSSNSIDRRRQRISQDIPESQIVTGQAFLHCDYGLGASKRIIVLGNGPVASLCCERALKDSTNTVYWISRNDFEKAFPRSRRFDKMGCRSTDGTPFEPLERNLVLAGNQTLEFKAMDTGHIGVVALPSVGAWTSNSEGEPVGLTTKLFDLLVVATGPKNPVDELFDGEEAGWDLYGGPVLDLPVALASPDQAIRILGAAALSHIDYRNQVINDSIKFGTMLKQLCATLPLHLDIEQPNLSVAVCGRFIAEANRYFLEHTSSHGPNWNCAFAPNIIRCLKDQKIQHDPADVYAFLRDRPSGGALSAIPAVARGAGDVVYMERTPSEYL